MATVTTRLLSPSWRTSLLRIAWRLDSRAGLLAMFAAALAVRLLIAPYAGFYGDLRLFRLWAERLADVGPHHFYVPGQFADYPPGYLYVLWLLGKVSAAPSYLLLKLPAILADLALAWLAGIFAARIAPAALNERLPVRALTTAAVLFNPAVIALSAVWGQVDAVPAAFVLASLLLLFTGERTWRREVEAFLLFAVAIAIKPQSGFVLPVMLYALYRRHLHGRSRPELAGGILRLVTPGILALELWSLSGIAFGLGPIGLVHFYSHSASIYQVTSANAFNFWGFVGFWRNDSVGSDVVSIAGISALHLGLLVFIAGVAFTLWRLHRAINRGADEARALTVAAAIVSLLAYAFLTRMHERYMFLSLGTLSPLVFVRQLRFALAALSGLFVLNLWYPYAYFNSQWRVEDLRLQPWFDWIFGGFATDTWPKKVWSLAVTGIALAVATRGFRWAELRAPQAPVRSRPVAPAVVEREPARAITTWTRWAPLAVVGAACVFGLITLRGETTPAPNLNDSAFHLQMVRWADDQIGAGRLPLDGWYPDLSLGSAQFHHYQSLPHTLTAYVARATGVSDEHTYVWLLYLLLALWPISVYCGARLLDWGEWTAAAAAAVSPLVVSAPGYGYEHGSYIWSGYGVYSQLWAMWLLPLAWGLTWRAVNSGKRFPAAAAAVALTIACHFITGYLALLTAAVWVLVTSGSFFVRIGRAAVVALGSLLVASWVLVPLIGDTKWTSRSVYYKGTFFNDSYGAAKVLGWLFTGRLFDDGRFPVITLLFYVGTIVCFSRVRRDVRARALLAAFGLSLLLFFGRRTLGPVIDVLPGMGDVQIHRFVMGVHLAGIFLAGVGLAWLAQIVVRLAHHLAPRWSAIARGAAAVAIGVVMLAPALVERASYDRHGAELIRAQRAYDPTDGRAIAKLVALVKARGDGRVYAGLRANWGRDFKVGYVPVYAWLADHDVDAIGFTFRTIASLSTDVEAAFDERNPAQYQMFNVRYVILPPGRSPHVPAKLVAASGNYRLWRVDTSGYFQVVDRAAAVPANRTDVEAATRSFRDSTLAARGIYPGVAFAGGRAPPPTFASAAPRGRPGTVVSQSQLLRRGVALATVETSRRAVVLLKATYDPRWTVTVDGRRAKTTMMAPSLVGVEVPRGRHVVFFRYEPYGAYPLLLALGALTLLALVFGPRRAAKIWPRLPLAGHWPSVARPRAVAAPAPRDVPATITALGASSLAIALALVATFLPVVIVGYAFSDDYPLLFVADGLGRSAWFGSNIIETVASDGRPIAGVLDQLFFSAAGTIDNLQFVRLLGLAGIVALALVIQRALVRAGIRHAVAALFTLLMCTTIPFQVSASWAVLFVLPYAALLAAGASFLIARAVGAPASVMQRRLLGACAALLAALLIYQPAAMYFWVFLAIALVGAATERGDVRQVARMHFAVGFVTLGIAFLVAKLAQHIVGDRAPNPARNALTHDVLGKIGWFFRGPLYQSLNFVDLTPSPWLAALVAAIAIGGVILLLRRRGLGTAFHLSVAAALIPLSFLPSLVVKENSPTYRVQVALTSLIVLYACLGVLGIWLTMRDRLRLRSDRVGLGTLAAIVAISAFVAAKHVMTLVVDPQMTELRMIRSQVAALPAGVARIGYVQIGWNQGPNRRYFSDELGVPSSARPWTPEPAILLILREEGRLPPVGQRPIVDILPWYTSPLPTDEPVIDLRGLERLR